VETTGSGTPWPVKAAGNGPRFWPHTLETTWKNIVAMSKPAWTTVLQEAIMMPLTRLTLAGELAQDICAGFYGALAISEHEAFLIEVRDSLCARLCDQHGNWTVDYVRLRFCACKPS